MISVINGALTPKCNDCPFWCDGSDIEKGWGCGLPAPISWCEAFQEALKEETES